MLCDIYIFSEIANYYHEWFAINMTGRKNEGNIYFIVTVGIPWGNLVLKEIISLHCQLSGEGRGLPNSLFSERGMARGERHYI